MNSMCDVTLSPPDVIDNSLIEVVVDDVEHDAEDDLSRCQVMVALLDVHSLLPLLDEPWLSVIIPICRMW